MEFLPRRNYSLDILSTFCETPFVLSRNPQQIFKKSCMHLERVIQPSILAFLLSVDFIYVHIRLNYKVLKKFLSSSYAYRSYVCHNMNPLPWNVWMEVVDKSIDIHIFMSLY